MTGTVRLDLTLFCDAPNDPRPARRADFDALAPEVTRAHTLLKNGEGDCLDKGVKMLGWQDLPERIGENEIATIEAAARELAGKIDAFVSLGIGGSYLGVDATFRFLTHEYFNRLPREHRRGAPEIYFLGNDLDPDRIRDTFDMLRGKRIGVNVISKSGTTTETAVAFRLLRALLEERYGDAAQDVIWATTDASRGALRQLAAAKGYRTFVVPDDVGGRFSILTDVGLASLAVAGIDLRGLVAGFRDMRTRCLDDRFYDNPAMVHAAARLLAGRHGKKIEVVAVNARAVEPVARWMEQLFPESEGHGGKGLWVATSMYSEKLHANGQMVQDGERNLIETFLVLEEHDRHVEIPRDEGDADGLNFLVEQGRDVNALNRLVVDGPAWAHYQGGVPVMKVLLPRRTAHVLGQLYYLMERSVALSGYVLGHNPFIQPGVEAYKQAMFALAGKPGFEAQRAALEAQLAQRPPFLVG